MGFILLELHVAHFALCLNVSECMRLWPIMSCCLFACFTLPRASLWPGTCFLPICHKHLSVSPFMSLSCCFWMSLTLCVPFCLYFLCLFLREPPCCISLYLHSGCLWVCFRRHAYLILHFPLMYLPFSLFLCLWAWFVCECVSFFCSHFCVHHWVVISLCPLLCLSVQHAWGRVGRQEKLPWYTPSLRPSLSVKRLKEII